MDIQTLRKEYQIAVESPRHTDYLLDTLLKNKPSKPIELAYVGATEALKAKHTRNPLRKLQFVRQALVILNQALQLQTDNLEIRFLRLSIQHHLPAFLKNQHLIEEDKSILLQNIDKGIQDQELSITIGNFLLASGLCKVSVRPDHLSSQQARYYM